MEYVVQEIIGPLVSEPDTSPLQLLEKHFGFKSFRPQQEEVINHVLAGHDAVVLMPTGGGKSLCYQVPALAKEGLTVVVSPLIALMKDQVQALQANGIPAAFLNSTLTFTEEQAIHAQLRGGAMKLLYVSPERLLSANFLDRVAEWNPALFAIDEAHCISSWGHAFRPEYKRLDVLKKRFPQVPMIALTATADKAVRSDIAAHLGMRNERLFTSSFDRPNLSLAVLPGQNRWQTLQRIMARHAGACGIIYCNSRKGTEKLAAQLQGIGVRADCYHAKMDAAERDSVQDSFIQGHTHVVCATIAFGMGIDKGDVRFVVHWNMPGTLEGYYQEIGRAGRDGTPAETILFYSYADVQTHIHFMEEVEDPQYKAIMGAKLDRIKEYAEAQVCRRTVLLSYFSEEVVQPCGNCDVCKNPPTYFDGTLLAQKALSAVYRCHQQLGMSVLIDVLKGTHSTEVQQQGYGQIKTFGAGADVSAFAWMMFLQQFIQYGLVEIDYKDRYHLKITPLGHRVLKGEHPVRLVTPETLKERQERTRKPKPKQSAATSATPASADLLGRLKALRLSISKEIGKPAFVVFSDATLIDMAEKQPRTITEFRQVNGVGDHKTKMYAERFLEVVGEAAG
ncbi:MAG: DNA helicase RecQ [Flavobacteriales bacterium]|nr:DNA helicase RecQ [Flavobacteriales bacterium]MBP9080560.1 DNA helicase RecQ [Flavobacteriales bacterium]